MIRLVLFDIDGTLIRTGGAGQQAFDRVSESVFGVPDGVADLNFAGRTDTSIARDFFVRHGIEPSRANFARFFDAYVFWLDHLLSQHAGYVLPGVAAWLEGLRRLRPAPVIGLLTGNIRLGAQIKLMHFGLWDFFEMGAFADDHEDRNRLAAVAFERGCKLLNASLAGGEVLVIGDTVKDIECGRAIGARVLAVATGGGSRAELGDHRPEWLVDTLEEVAPAAVCGGE